MKPLHPLLFSSLCVVSATLSPCAAAQRAAHFDLFASDDADDTSVLRSGVTVDYRFIDIERYRGIKLEQARIAPAGQDPWRDQRAYYRFADRGEQWLWTGQIGTDGGTVLGNASLVREGRLRQEYFLERDILETPRGINGLYHTFAGASLDVPLDRRGHHQLTGLVGLQLFSGDNLRTHARARYVASLVPGWGLSAQLRVRAFRNSDPFEFDYYSPRWFAEALPVLQVRRFRSRWMYRAAVGVGRQSDSESGTRAARMAEVGITSPRSAANWYFRADASYSNTPTGAGQSYGYRQLTLEWIKPL